MDRLFLLLRENKDSYIGGADSFTDRISNQYTVSILAMFAIMTTTRQFVSEPIACWCPVSFSKDQVDYVNKVCWTTSTYYLPDSVREIPLEGEPINRVSYYQWIPLMAIGQAAMFYIPRILWNLLNKNSGIAVNTITDAAMERQKRAEQTSAEKTMEFMTKTLGKFLKELSWDCAQRPSAGEESLRGCCKRCTSLSCLCNAGLYRHIRIIFYGNYLTCLYIIIKITYLANVVIQIVLLNSFLKTNYSLYGLETISKMLRGDDWTTSERFPRIAMCNFHVRAMGENLHRHSVQCSIPINLLHEIFYIFLWFWLIFVFIVTFVSLLGWIILSFPERARVTYIRNKVYADGKLRRNPDRETEDIFNEFAIKYLKRDGCFIARLVAKNTSTIVAADLLGGLWKDYYKKTQIFRYQMREGSAPVEGSKKLFRPESLLRLRSYGGRDYKEKGEAFEVPLIDKRAPPFAPPFDLSPPPATITESLYNKGSVKSGGSKKGRASKVALDDVDGEEGTSSHHTLPLNPDNNNNNSDNNNNTDISDNNNNRIIKSAKEKKRKSIPRPSIKPPLPRKPLLAALVDHDDGGDVDDNVLDDDGRKDDGFINSRKNSLAARRLKKRNEKNQNNDDNNNNNNNNNSNNNDTIIDLLDCEAKEFYRSSHKKNNENINEEKEEEEEEEEEEDDSYNRRSTKRLYENNKKW